MAGLARQPPTHENSVKCAINKTSMLRDSPKTNDNKNNTPLGQNICILFYFQAVCKFLGL